MTTPFAAIRALHDALDRAEAERDAAYAAGQLNMRGRAAEAVLYLLRSKGVDRETVVMAEAAHLIHALPILKQDE